MPDMKYIDPLCRFIDPKKNPVHTAAPAVEKFSNVFQKILTLGSAGAALRVYSARSRPFNHCAP
jgi:hypothetical protein